jgi:HSP20 family molecular chaperone IbpA
MTGFASPFLVGFDRLEQALERIARATPDGYPPYNVEAVGAERILVTLAVAGFTSDDLSVEVEGGTLTVRGRKPESQGERAYLYRGIATRGFQRVFLLADGIEVTGARLENGILAIELARPDARPGPRRIPIRVEGEEKAAPRLVAQG